MNPDVKTGVTLGIAACLAIAVIYTVYKFTENKIVETSQVTLQEQIQQLLKPGSYDNDPSQNRVYVNDAALGTAESKAIYRATLTGKPSGSVIEAVAPDGYSGDIHLLVGVTYHGDVVGVRVTHHRETPGLGDDIEQRRSDWIMSFDNLKQGEMAANDWQVKKDGGQFDQFTGATITPRAVVSAVYRVVNWHNDNKVRLFAAARFEMVAR